MRDCTRYTIHVVWARAMHESPTLVPAVRVHHCRNHLTKVIPAHLFSQCPGKSLCCVDRLRRWCKTIQPKCESLLHPLLICMYFSPQSLVNSLVGANLLYPLSLSTPNIGRSHCQMTPKCACAQFRTNRSQSPAYLQVRVYLSRRFVVCRSGSRLLNVLHFLSYLFVSLHTIRSATVAVLAQVVPALRSPFSHRPTRVVTMPRKSLGISTSIPLADSLNANRFGEPSYVYGWVPPSINHSSVRFNRLCP